MFQPNTSLTWKKKKDLLEETILNSIASFEWIYDVVIIVFSLAYKFEHASTTFALDYCTNLKLEINYEHLYGFCDADFDEGKWHGFHLNDAFNAH